MGFLDFIKKIIGNDASVPTEDRARLAQAWGLSEEELAPPGSEAQPGDATALAIAGSGDYDRARWQKKLRFLLDKLPDSRDQWDDFLSDAHALGFDREWLATVKKEEFGLLVRRLIADRLLSPAEHDQLDLARKLLDITEPQAEEIVHRVIEEAETIFGRKIEGL
jgi:hypothetical protein